MLEAIYKDCTLGSGHIFVLRQVNGCTVKLENMRMWRKDQSCGFLDNFFISIDDPIFMVNQACNEINSMRFSRGARMTDSRDTIAHG